jgi:hypothetical protein
MVEAVDVMNLTLAAKDQGMLETGFAWLGLDTVADANVSEAPAAMSGWVFFEERNLAPEAFFHRVREATRARFGCPGGDATTDTIRRGYAANMYDAVMLYAVAVASNSSRLSNGTLMAQAMKNASFDGMTGRVELDENGDMKVSILAWNYVLLRDSALTPTQIGMYDALGARYDPNSTAIWPGGTSTVPLDAPAAAGDIELKYLILGAVLGVMLLVLGSLLVYQVRTHKEHFKLFLKSFVQHEGMLAFKIGWDVCGIGGVGAHAPSASHIEGAVRLVMLQGTSTSACMPVCRRTCSLPPASS